ncbi:prephenate dehydrogenase/arogenate dehydrogenase family protein [Aquabacterium sp. A7-Y]|uniref:prephenate dehydrogenase/arogenate dehydrogenase family protein n=1 Tax=Aquabacterium sp. A7-Y TaxID=1349605 RepID=UPI00223E1726|nr:prephenate dehydrogenase/arogenate dehydrogenase family protein [Aquabacterium sp. A7-Y]MCW7537009.1 prephenate dehydrogenase/arogenate dehydrogenase family protein [Aquabacterium sp. A7-Y]
MTGTSTDIKQCAVVGAAGSIGEFFLKTLRGFGVTASGVDLRPGSPLQASLGETILAGDIRAPSAEMRTLIGTSQLVMLALPLPVTLKVVLTVIDAMQPGALLVETSSVKTEVAKLLEIAGDKVEVLGVNPMFAPDLGVKGRAIVAVPIRSGHRTDAFLDLLLKSGASVVKMDATRHDRLASVTQSLTHAAVLSFGLALVSLGEPIADLQAVAPPPFSLMMALLARISSGTPEVYSEIQYANPSAHHARVALLQGLQALAQDGTAESIDFEHVIQSLRKCLGGAREPHARLCAELFGCFTATSLMATPSPQK